MALELHFRERSSFLLNLLHILDCLLVVAMLWLSAEIHQMPWTKFYSSLAAGSFILCFFSFYSVKLYRPWRGIKLYKELLVILKAWMIFASIILSIFFLFKVSEQYSRIVIISWLAATPLTIFLIHLMMRKMLGFLRRRGKNLRYAVIVGAGDLGLRLVRHIRDLPWAGIKIAGFFDDKKTVGGLLNGRYPILGNINHLPAFLKNNKIDYVYIALPLRAESKIVSILNECRALGAQIFMVPDLFAFDIFNAEFQTLGSMPVINFNPEYPWKRYFDIVFSLAVIIASLPLTLIIALFIKLEDWGSVFYGAKRITMAGKEFKCWKFRTMVADADKKLAHILNTNPEAQREWDTIFKLKQDPRITKIGRILRKFSIDELPQFINVLKGDMSIVGARPVEHAQLVQHYKENAGLYCSLKPGITGPWQIGPRGDMEHYNERVELDLWYLHNLSFWLDMKIICRTISVVFNGKGAY